jgi:predicted ATPase
MKHLDLSEAAYQPALAEKEPERFVVISGCSGGGKSALLAELARRGLPVFEEAGRQVVKEQLHIGGGALSWDDIRLFIELTVSRSIYNLVTAARSPTRAFFDRGIVDQVAGADQLALPGCDHLRRAARRFRYHRTVFFVPPWREIFRNDDERRHSFEDAAASYAPLRTAYESRGYEVVELPLADVVTRADFVLTRLSHEAQA